MFVKKKKNRSGFTSVVVVEKKQGKYILMRTLGSANTPRDIETLVLESKKIYQRIFQQILGHLQTLNKYGQGALIYGTDKARLVRTDEELRPVRTNHYRHATPTVTPRVGRSSQSASKGQWM